MKFTSKTGLTASPTKKIVRYDVTKTVQLRAIARPAPFTLKPFAGLYNPYPHGCSLLCNHPTNNQAREMLRQAKENWAYEGKTRLLAEEIEAIREGLNQINTNEHLQTQANLLAPQVESVPEELFRRYTETDSRPLTPAPTLASGATKASGSRRCITPDPHITNQIKEKTLLVLDLRRSHSQETLSYYGSSSLLEPPLIRIQHVGTTASTLEASAEKAQDSKLEVLECKRPKSNRKTIDAEELEMAEKNSEKDAEEEDDEEFITRRGRKRRKKSRDPSRGPPAFQASLDPETQVATLADSHNPSARPSLVPAVSSQDLTELEEKRKRLSHSSKSFDSESYLDKEILRQLRRELNEEIVDNELNYKRRKALEEALKTIPKNKLDCEELKALQKELNVPPINSELWISLPRTFTRSSARFELPMNSYILSTMTPIDYVRDNVSITSARKLLYNCIFNKYKLELDECNNYERKLSGENMPACLNLIMGKRMTQTQSDNFKELVGWRESDVYDFKTCCGIFALCERLLAPEFCPQLPNRKDDPCHEVPYTSKLIFATHTFIETADFEVLSRKLHGQQIDERVIKLLNAIKTL
ncbi:hypothetical protein NQ318_019184 [Aromia moschata]|uniref:Uncharacterized protein n=1 Tax=Aromia moschata TaxID=1265417 RepID=A0AAV8YSX9_9CUCU|nr:hypothetical protein NQ318_019184 [Aromia moschata]